MRGELGIKIKSIEIQKYEFDDFYEMRINDEDGSFLFIVGDNDLPTLFKEALENITLI